MTNVVKIVKVLLGMASLTLLILKMFFIVLFKLYVHQLPTSHIRRFQSPKQTIRRLEIIIFFYLVV